MHPSNDTEATLRSLLARRILILDGAMGTMIQQHRLSEEQYRGAQFAGHARDLKGNNELLSLTRPDLISEIHEAYFAAGADISEFPRERFDVESGRRYHLDLIAPALRALQCAPQPVIAAIEGSCVGGGLEIASVCDLRIGALGCRLGAPVGRLGFPLALPELAPMLRLAGPALVSDLLLTGRLLQADEAQAAGLLQRVVAAEELDAAVEQLVEAVRAGSPLAARLNKANIRMLVEQGGAFTDAQLVDSFGFFASDDYSEGLQAFLSKRKPIFRGR